MTTTRALLWCLLVVVGVGAAVWALSEAAPRGTRAARETAPRRPRSETHARAAPAKRERVRTREARSESYTPPSAEQLDPPGAPRTPDAGTPSRVGSANTSTLGDVSDGVTLDVLPSTPHATRAAPLEQVVEESGSEPPEREDRLPPRRVELTAFRAWQQPGLCAKHDTASDAHATLMRRFRVVDGEGGGRFYVDPRLPEGAESSVLVHLEAAERQSRVVLGLTAQSPDVFIYHDLELLLAAACINEEVVAYYDGALHVVGSRNDVRESVLHEYAHHALMMNGVLGPTWAHEGIAMHVASETWWRSRQWLDRVADKPFSIDVMEREIPYTLSAEQAVLFYVQAGAMVACAAREGSEGLAGLVRALGASHSGDELSYDLTAPTTPMALRACVGRLLRGTP